MNENEVFYVLSLIASGVAIVIGFLSRASMVGWGVLAAGAGAALIAVGLLF